MTISILLVDDHVIFREGVRAFLEATTDFHIAGEAGDGAQALVMAGRLRPDVMVLDYMMPTLSGLEVLCRLQQQLPGPEVVILSLHNDEFYVDNAITNGASGYVLKEDVVAHLALAITAAAAGQFYFSPILRERIILSKPGNPAKRLECFDALTRRIPDARVNDIGKIGIPDNILLKPGPLTPDEWQIMKEHTSVGSKILGRSKSAYLKMDAEIAFNHHERWDGSGYPGGKQGEAIPMASRLMNICDIYDAL